MSFRNDYCIHRSAQFVGQWPKELSAVGAILDENSPNRQRGLWSTIAPSHPLIFTFAWQGDGLHVFTEAYFVESLYQAYVMG